MPYRQTKADKISQDCDARLLSLHIPPGKRGHIQMTKAEVKKAKNIANLRILAEQVIRSFFNLVQPNACYFANECR